MDGTSPHYDARRYARRVPWWLRDASCSLDGHSTQLLIRNGDSKFYVSKNVLFRKRSLFLCAGHSEAAKEATVTPDMDMDTDTDAVCGPEPG